MEIYETNINIVIPPVWTGVYINTARLLKYSIEDLGLNVSICEVGEMRNGEFSIILGWHLIPDDILFEKPYIIYQLEPLILSQWRDKMRQKIKLFQNAEAVWDYSEANKEFLGQSGFQPEIVPLGYHRKLNDVNQAEYPDHDVLFVGFMTERRKRIINELSKYCCVSVKPRWGKDFADALRRSKILLNIHQYDMPTPLEQPRISYALNNRSFVISEVSVDFPYKNLVVCDSTDIVKTVKEYLYSPINRSEIKSKVLRNFKETSMIHFLPERLKNFRARSKHYLTKSIGV